MPTARDPFDKAPLVSVKWLAERIGDPHLRIVDGSWDFTRDVKAEYLAQHIPGAVQLDIRDVRDHDHPVQLMLPAAAQFAEAVGALGIASRHRVIVYDSGGMLNAGRVWWMFRTFGHRDVAVLDGGLPAWLAAGGAVEAGAVDVTPEVFKAHFDLKQLRTLDQMKAIVEAGGEQVVDVRSAERFRGDTPEARPGVRAGHMPGSRNLPYSLLTGPDHRLKSPAELMKLLAAAKVDLAHPVVTSCGGGVAAGILSLALERMGKHDWALYDGSWSEWATQADTPVAAGPAE